ncbi:unnamed protein product [Zymoseptoria tritici ST99CH_1A5]|uniref:Uncharacterized protein n=1 Tax=Zymoseptoria tritici ST99CH_1A5 TaxID=1276529 RepID=A0A1Y6LFK5_ZYMTR|nr:unnamed protein product [Zymoseptoria tritici ST99CH_1A5]
MGSKSSKQEGPVQGKACAKARDRAKTTGVVDHHGDCAFCKQQAGLVYASATDSMSHAHGNAIPPLAVAPAAASTPVLAHESATADATCAASADPSTPVDQVNATAQTQKDVSRKPHASKKRKRVEASSPKGEGKWWSDIGRIGNERIANATTQTEHYKYLANPAAYIARIMCSDMGEQRYGEERCSRCIEAGFECWVYKDKGLAQGTACARCRKPGGVKTRGGCSISGRVGRRGNEKLEGKEKAEGDKKPDAGDDPAEHSDDEPSRSGPAAKKAKTKSSNKMKQEEDEEQDDSEGNEKPDTDYNPADLSGNEPSPSAQAPAKKTKSNGGKQMKQESDEDA